MDLSGISTEDLMALKGGDLSKVSTAGLQALRHASTAAQIENDPISQGARDLTGGMSGLDKFNAGAGKAMSDIGLGVRQALGFAGKQDVQESRLRDAPLMRTGAGIAGNIGGNVAALAPAALLSGGSVPAAAAINGVIGWLQPHTTDTEHAINTGLGAVGGAVGQYGANQAATAAANQQANNAATAARGAQTQGAAQRASAAGYVIPPEDLANPSMATRILQGVGGKIKTAQVASERNQDVTNRLARQALGMAPDAQMTVQDLAAIRNQAAQTGYAPVRAAGQVVADPQFANDLNQIVGTYQGAVRSFPGLHDNGVADIVAAVNQPHFDAGDAVDAIRHLRQTADTAFANRNADVGQAARDSANAIEGMLERHLQAAGNPDALNAFRDARRQIAQTYSVQAGLNTTTGDVAANALAKQLARNRPLTGDLRTIAEAAQAYPKATQALKESPKALSPLDMALAAVKGDPMGLLTLGARPLARSIMLSGPVQDGALERMAQPQNANMLLRLASNPALTVPAASLGGPAAGNALARFLIGEGSTNP